MVIKSFYKLIDHTADFGILVVGKNPQGLFQNAAMALTDQLVEKHDPGGGEQTKLQIRGQDWTDLMINWLREILYLWAGKDVLLHSVEIDTIKENELSASLWFDRYSPERHQLKSEIKAVTYHQAQVRDNGDHWEATIIFDI